MTDKGRSLHVGLGLVLLLLLGACSEGEVVQRDYPAADTLAAKLMLAKCSGCHAAPLPSAHSADMWPAVVRRMQIEMKLRASPPLNDEDMKSIIEYLQTYAEDGEG